MMLDALIWLDVKVLWLLTFGRSRPGETISAAAWSLRLDGKWQGRVFVPCIDFLFRPWGACHCRDAYIWQAHLYEKGRP